MSFNMEMSKAVEREFATYARWFEFSLDKIWHLTPAQRAKYDPLAAVRDVKDKPTKRQVKALSQAVKDTVGMTDRHSAAELAALDASFLAQGLPSVSFLKTVYSKDLEKILGQGSIDNEEDYYLLKSLEDLDVPDDTKRRARELYGKYEIDHL
jgi:hypothetical protein